MKVKIYLLVLFLFFSFFLNLGRRSIENIDYVKYAEIAREILENKDWVMLHENGEIYVDKPPLHFWNIAICYKIFGVNPFSARFPSAFFALLITVFLLLFARRILGSWDIGVISALILASSYGFFFFSQRTRIDLEYSVIFSLSLFFFYLGIQRKKWFFYALFWIFTGLSFMDKGPVAFLNLLIVLTYWLISRKKNLLSPSFEYFIITLPFLFIPTLPWIYELTHHKDFYLYLAKLKRVRIMTRNAGFLYYFPQLVEKFAPGIIFLPVSYKVLKLEKVRNRSLLYFLLTWCIVYFIILNLTHVKNHRYLLPIFPPLSLIFGWALFEALERKMFGKFFKICAASFLTIGLIASLLLPLVTWKYFGFHVQSLLIATVGCIAMILFWRFSERKICIVFISALFIYLYIDSAQVLRNHAASEVWRGYELLMDHKIKSHEVAVYKSCGKIREILSFYYNKLLPCISNADNARYYKALVLRKENLGDVAGEGFRAFLIKDYEGKGKDFYVLLRDGKDGTW